MPVAFDASALFTEDSVRRTIELNKQQSRKQFSGPRTAFLPPGKHMIRWFGGPKGEYFREVMVGQVGKKRFLCPDYAARFDKLGSYPECRLCKDGRDENQWMRRCKYNCMIYGFLYETKNPTQFWAPGNAYVIMGNGKLKSQFVAVMENLIDVSSEMLLKMLNPTLEGFMSSTSFTSGKAGDASIQLLMNKVQPIELGDWYVPLDQVYVSAVFDRAMYDSAIADYLELGENSNANATDDGADGHDSEEEERTLEEMNKRLLDAFPQDLQKPVDTEKLKNVTPITVTTVLPATANGDIHTEEKSGTVPTPQRSVPRPIRGKKDGSLPEGITLDMLPENCPGWGQFSAVEKTCILCPHNMPCMKDAA